MNDIDIKLHEVVLGNVKDLLKKGEDDYEACRHILLAQSADDEKLQKFIIELFKYTDNRRPLLVERKAGVLDASV